MPYWQGQAPVALCSPAHRKYSIMFYSFNLAECKASQFSLDKV